MLPANLHIDACSVEFNRRYSQAYLLIGQEISSQIIYNAPTSVSERGTPLTVSGDAPPRPLRKGFSDEARRKHLLICVIGDFITFLDLSERLVARCSYMIRRWPCFAAWSLAATFDKYAALCTLPFLYPRGGGLHVSPSRMARRLILSRASPVEGLMTLIELFAM